MILTGPEIVEQVRGGRIVIEPFDNDHVNPNSYNFRLGRTLRVYSQFPVDPRCANPYEEIEIPSEGLLLDANRLYLAHTEEVLGSEHFAPTFSARSSVARLGLFINLSASLGDIGFVGQWTLQLFAVHPIRVYPGMRIGQMMWWRPQGEIGLYDGKYQGSKGPQSTLIHRDFELPVKDELPTLSWSPAAADTGAKFSNLARASHIAPVPRSFCIPATWLLEALDDDQERELERIIGELRATVGAFVVSAAAEAAEVLADLTIPEDLEARVRSRLIEIFGMPDEMRFAVRSSAGDEDGSSSSMAGVYDSALRVQGVDGVLDAIISCWTAAYGGRALAARSRRADFDWRPSLSLIVQEMIDAETSGVAFTSGSEGASEVIVEYVAGTGEQLVSGVVAPERLMSTSLPADESATPSWAGDLFAMARSLHDHFGHPVDIEFAVADGEVWLLQVRPVTAGLGASGSATGPVFEVADLYAADLAEGIELGQVAGVYAQYVRKRGPAYLVARAAGAETSSGSILNFTSGALASAAASAFEAELEAGPGESVVIDLGDNVRQVIVPASELLSTLRTLVPGDGHEVHAAIVRNFVRGDLGFISRRSSSGLLLEYAPEGLLAINRGVTSTSIIERDADEVRGGEDVPELVANLDAIEAVTASMEATFGGVQLEWVLDRGTARFVDYSLEQDAPEVRGVDGALMLSAGTTRGRVLALDNDDLLEQLSIGPAVSVGKQGHILDDDLGTVMSAVRASDHPIVWARRPYAVLSLLIDHVVGFVFEEGSLLCHLAILLREAGLPSIVATGVEDGDEVLIADGVLEVLARPETT